MDKREIEIPQKIIDMALAKGEEILNLINGIEGKTKDIKKIDHKTKMEIRMKEDLSKIEEIVASLGEINVTGLTNEQKIQFAYSVSKLNYQVKTIFNYICFNKLNEKYPAFMVFCTHTLRYSYLNEENKNSKSKYKKPKENDSWLKPFKIESKFLGKDGEVIRCFYQNKSGMPVEITPAHCQEIIRFLACFSIPDTTCIIQEALKQDALNEIDTFIDRVNSGNYINYEKKSNCGYVLTPNGIIGTIK